MTSIRARPAGKRFGLTPRARIVGMTTAGVPSRIMGIGAAPASQKPLKQLGMTIDQMDVIELNEAFASQGLAVLRQVTTAMYQLHCTSGHYALCTMCIGVGQGIAMVIERLRRA